MTEDKASHQMESCPYCAGALTPYGLDFAHPVNDCWLSAVKIMPHEFDGWNRRAAKPAVPVPLPSQENVRELAEEYCDVREEYERDREWRFNYPGLQNFAVSLLSAAPPLPVAQGAPDIGATWEQAICEVEAGIKLAELRPNQIPGLFQILRRNVEAKLAAAPKEPT